ncbi:MAG: aldose 1-epimerase family protein [Planctomyces sp.]|nr:aldose 1-epimerase family protein [Planctomyces sp.]
MTHREALPGVGPHAPETVVGAAHNGPKLKGSEQWSISRRRLTGGMSEGVEVVDLNNGRMTVSVVPTRGMGVWRAQCGEVPVEWQSPVRQLVHPSLVNLASRNGLGWLDGFNELVCRCGLAFNGPPGADEGAKGAVESQVTLHGRTANLPARDVVVEVDDQGDGVLAVSGIVDECTLFGPQLRLRSTVRTVAGSTAFTIVDEIENLGSTSAELELLYHINLGRPFLEQGSSVACPARAVVPRDERAAEGMERYAVYEGPTSGYAEQVYYFEPIADRDGRTLALLKNAHGHLGVSVAWNVRELPRFTLWKCTQADADGYVTGLEPGTNLPNFKGYEREQGRVVELAAGGKHRAEVTLTVHDSPEAVADAERRVRELQGNQPPVVHRAPQPGWSAAGEG